MNFKLFAATFEIVTELIRVGLKELNPDFIDTDPHHFLCNLNID